MFHVLNQNKENSLSAGWKMFLKRNKIMLIDAYVLVNGST